MGFRSVQIQLAFLLFNGDVQRDNLQLTSVDLLLHLSKHVLIMLLFLLLDFFSQLHPFLYHRFDLFHEFCVPLRTCIVGHSDQLQLLIQFLNFRLQFRNFAFETLSLASCIPSLGIELPRPRRSTVSPEQVVVEHGAPWKLSDFGTPHTMVVLAAFFIGRVGTPPKIFPSLFKSFSLS